MDSRCQKSLNEEDCLNYTLLADKHLPLLLMSLKNQEEAMQLI